MSEFTGQIDVIQTLRTAIAVWWAEFAPITLLGFALLMVPSLLVQLLLGNGTEAATDGAGTLAATLLGVLNLLYFCTVAFGVIAGLAGRRLDLRTFIAAGLRAAQPGLVASLTLAVFALALASLMIVANLLGPVGALMILASVAGLLWAASAFLPAVPAAIAERRQPLDALRRSLALSSGQRWRLLGLVVIVGLGLLPPAIVIRLVMFGPTATPLEIERIMDGLTVADPRLWIAQLSNVLLSGLLACVPPVVYVQLVRLKSAGRG